MICKNVLLDQKNENEDIYLINDFVVFFFKKVKKSFKNVLIQKKYNIVFIVCNMSDIDNS